MSGPLGGGIFFTHTVVQLMVLALSGKKTVYNPTYYCHLRHHHKNTISRQDHTASASTHWTSVIFIVFLVLPLLSNKKQHVSPIFSSNIYMCTMVDNIKLIGDLCLQTKRIYCTACEVFKSHTNKFVWNQETTMQWNVRVFATTMMLPHEPEHSQLCTWSGCMLPLPVFVCNAAEVSPQCNVLEIVGQMLQLMVPGATQVGILERTNLPTISSCWHVCWC